MVLLKEEIECYLIWFYLWWPKLCFQIPITFWGYALETTDNNLNHLPTKKATKTPSEIWNDKPPSLAHLKIQGCDVLVSREASEKLEPRSKNCYFVGYPKKLFGYIFLIMLLRTKCLLHEGASSPRRRSCPKKLIGAQLLPYTDPIKFVPYWILCFHIETEGEVLINNHTLIVMDETSNYREAMARSKDAKRKESMESDIQFMYDNHVLNMVDPTPDIKTSRCK